MGAYPRRRLRFGRVLVFIVCLVLVSVYILSLKLQDPDLDPVHLRVRDMDQDLNPDLKQDQDPEQFSNGVSNLKKNMEQVQTSPPVVIQVNRTDIQTCVYVDKPEATDPPPTNRATKSKGEYPVDLFSLEQRQHGWVVLHLFGMIYMFVALAIVCDEFFVPALEVITEKLEISDDVAGATFMAAGGSAPELFTSLIGVFIARSNIGIGTIVGSAVFNILFVIGMCAIFSREMLHLTWWPLFRDVSFYILDLMMLIVFFLDNAIRWWESALLVLGYISYVAFMKFNAQIEKAVKTHCSRHKNTVQVWRADETNKVRTLQNIRTEEHNIIREEIEEKKMQRRGSDDHMMEKRGSDGAEDAEVTEAPPPPPAPAPEPEPKPTVDPEPQSPKIRRTSDPQMDRSKIKTRPALQRGGSTASLHNASMRNTIFQLMIHTLDPLNEDLSLNGDVKTGQRRVRSRVQPLSTALAETEENTASEDGDQNAQCDLPVPEPSTSHKVLEKTTEPPHETKIPEESEPSSRSSCSSCSDDEEEEEDGEAEEEEEIAPLSLDWPQTLSKQVSYLLLLPIIFPLWVTLPDVRNSASKRYFAMTFVGSILWIGIFSYLMVWWAHQVGETVGISEEIMGLTILAAGTSIPDLITSVIVARKGLGDMAVSSSVGSNIFDITVGLPVPWLLFSLTHDGESVAVRSNGLFCAIVLLFLMLLFVIASIAACRWKMSRKLGFTMFLLYFLFLVLSVLLQNRILTCPVSV
ncbi:sodium/potassium/calcium exchanger 2-like [Periophthalmus magnuspinnatus]|uniref:sodium/potassium/calcium exchanger 2-like n=1 Tax=Periophthalmus magnuspinnatus TaxID=409849 RepID=UPI00243712E1|nr:sodium/potassium/calcium exchanger 2-like [Periophthalmus magnuspinnatus]